MSGLDVLVQSSGDPEHTLAVIRRLIAASHDPTNLRTLNLRPYEAYLIVAALQLTVTHPELGDSLRDQYLDIGHQVQHLFDGEVFELLERGWREFDGSAGEMAT